MNPYSDIPDVVWFWIEFINSCDADNKIHKYRQILTWDQCCLDICNSTLP